MGRRSTTPQALLLLAAGVVLSLLALAVGGRVSPRDGRQILIALEEQVPVFSWGVVEAARRRGEELLVVDGRPGKEHEAGRPEGSLGVPFESRHDELHQLPQGRQVHAVLVVMDAGDGARARELAQALARQWGVSEVATLEGGWQAWVEAGLPREEG